MHLVHTGGRTIHIQKVIIPFNSEINDQIESNSVFVIKLTPSIFSTKMTFSLLLFIEPHTVSETDDIQALAPLYRAKN